MHRVFVLSFFVWMSACVGVAQSASLNEVSSSANNTAKAFGSAKASDSANASQAGASVAQTVDVTAAAEPMPLTESNRAVEVLEPQVLGRLNASVVDALRDDASLDLQARAPVGVQADLAIRGTTFEQGLVLVNGMRINDPETGHLNLDIPLPLDAVTRVDVLHGSGSTFYGSDAIGGAVNLLTSRPGDGVHVVASSGGGSYGSLEEHLKVGFAGDKFAEQVTGSRETSDGFMADRNYSSNALASETWLKTALGTTDVLLGGSDRPYGANQFYGPYNSWERTKGWFAGVQQQLGAKTWASFGYRKHSDLFVLFAGQPELYENNHVTSSYEGAVRRSDDFGKHVTLAYGLEADGDSIRSSSLGMHARNQGAGYASLGLRGMGRFTLSVGAREEVLSGKGSVFSPNVAAGFALSSTLKLRGSVGHGFRLPTYVDLYYTDPTTIGNATLKPESSWSYEGGLDWAPAGGRVRLSATGFHLQEKDAIDYSKPMDEPNAPWQAVNVQDLRLSGAEAKLRLRLPKGELLELAYTAVQSGGAPPGRTSEYAFNYAAQNAVFSWVGQLKQVALRSRVNVVQRTGWTAYPVWEVGASRNTGVVRPYVRVANLSNTGYQEIVGVQQPGGSVVGGVPAQGRTIMGGVEVNWSRR